MILQKKYFTGLIANTDLHAGGLFFCIIYKKGLVFLENEVVQLSRELVDPFRPMDDVDVKRIEQYRFTGKYFFNDRKYIECHFQDLDLVLVGMPTEKDPDILAFHAYDERSKRQWSEVYLLEK